VSIFAHIEFHVAKLLNIFDIGVCQFCRLKMAVVTMWLRLIRHALRATPTECFSRNMTELVHDATLESLKYINITYIICTKDLGFAVFAFLLIKNQHWVYQQSVYASCWCICFAANKGVWRGVFSVWEVMKWQLLISFHW